MRVREVVVDIETTIPDIIISKEIEQKANDLDIMVDLMKEKNKISSRKVKIQILTMIPSSWTVRKTANFFGVSNYMVRQAFKLRKEHGFFASPEHKMMFCSLLQISIVMMRIADFFQGKMIMLALEGINICRRG